MRAAALLAPLLIAAPAAAQEVDLPEGFVLKPLVLGLSAGTEGLHRVLPEKEGLFKGFTALEIERVALWAGIEWSAGAGAEPAGPEEFRLVRQEGGDPDAGPPAEAAEEEPASGSSGGSEYLLGVPSSLDPPVPPERPPGRKPRAPGDGSPPPPEGSAALEFPLRDVPSLRAPAPGAPAPGAPSPETVPGMAELDAWLVDRLAGETGPVADLGLLLIDEDSPLAGPSFDDVRPDPDAVAESLRLIVETPEAFCDGPRGAYNLAAATRELDCAFPFGRFRSHLLLRLHRTDGGWLLVRARAANSERYRQLLQIADSLRQEE